MAINAGSKIRATHVDDLVTLYWQACTALTTFAAGSGNVRQSIAGLTFDIVTINANAVVNVTWHVDCSITTIVAANNFQFRLEVDGVAQGPLAIHTTATATRDTVSNSCQITHASPGTFTYAISGISGSATPGCTIAANLSTMSAICVDKP